MLWYMLEKRAFYNHHYKEHTEKKIILNKLSVIQNNIVLYFQILDKIILYFPIIYDTNTFI